MSGLDGLGWPNPEDEPKPKKTMNSQLEIKLATKMIDTPETDAMEYFDAMCDPDRVVEADFARKLERERDELREWASVNGVSSLAKDRDQFRAQLREEQQLHVQTLNERDEAQEQRYRLAAVLQRIRDGYGGQAAAPDCCEDCEFLIPIDEALQSLNQPTEMTDERWGYGAGTSRAGLRITNQSERLVPVAITPLFIIL